MFLHIWDALTVIIRTARGLIASASDTAKFLNALLAEKTLSTWAKLIVYLSLRVERSETKQSQHFAIAMSYR
ncbi:MAG: hypothetical protein AAFY76_08910, partial [Cyanobacteria bacterium J06649_11]